MTPTTARYWCLAVALVRPHTIQIVEDMPKDEYDFTAAPDTPHFAELPPPAAEVSR
jgi:hypothetical protein